MDDNKLMLPPTQDRTHLKNEGPTTLRFNHLLGMKTARKKGHPCISDPLQHYLKSRHQSKCEIAQPNLFAKSANIIRTPSLSFFE